MKLLSGSTVALAIVLLVSAATFGIGASMERAHASKSAGSVGHSSSETGGETAAQHEAERGGAKETDSETIFGINPESTPLTVAAIGASVLLALLLVVWGSSRKLILAAVVVFGVLFAVLDIRESLHQANESNTGLLVIAIAAALLHAAAGIGAGAQLRVRQ